MIPAEYPLHETESTDYAERTERNVNDSDGTLIFACEAELSGGTRFTWECAHRLGRPVLVVLESEGIEKAAGKVGEFITGNCLTRLNVAGPRESQAPGLQLFVRAVLERLIAAR